MWPRKKPAPEPKKSYFPAETISLGTVTIPDDWIVLEMGQSPLHCLWHCHIYNMKTKRSISVEEFDTPFEAIQNAVNRI